MILRQPFPPTSACTSSAERASHPYYIVAKGYRKADPGNRLLHRLCSWLNQSGHESWMITADTHAPLWTPKLHDSVRAQHHAAAKCPVVICLDEKLASSADLGTKVHYQFNPFSPPSPLPPKDGHLAYAWSCATPLNRLRLPFLDLTQPAGEGPRTEKLVYADRYLAAGGALGDLPTNATRLTAADWAQESTLVSRLAQAHTLYLFEPSVLSALARAVGCAVVHVRNPLAWEETDPAPKDWPPTMGLVETTDWRAPPPVPHWTAAAFLSQYTAQLQGWENDLAQFVTHTQSLAAQTPLDQAWPAEVVLTLPVTHESLAAAARRADSLKQLRVNQQLSQWTQRSTLREIDGEIYGAYVASGQLPALATVVYADDNADALANTLESLGNSLLQPHELTIVSPLPNPFGDEGDNNCLQWVQLPSGGAEAAQWPPKAPAPLGHVRAPWVLALKAGATFPPNATLEFAIAAQNTDVVILYADEDLWVNGKPQHPYFKPHANVELLRSTNYLGDAVLVQASKWKSHPESHRFEGVYACALQALEDKGRQGLGHLDNLLIHATGRLTDAQLTTELAQVQAHLARAGLASVVKPGEQRGLRDISYTPGTQRVSVVVPSATQTGYLDCLLQSLATHSSPLLLEVLVVTDTEFAHRVQQTVDAAHTPFPTRVITLPNHPYSHAKALNAGAAHAQGNVLLFADDDTEVVHGHWLPTLCGLFNQPDIAAVAPRLVRPGSPDPILSAGPAFLGLGGVYASYCGERGNVLENGPYGRLQASQDVSAFAPHFFLVNAAHFKRTGGFDEVDLPLFLPVLDFALRASTQGLRHVWSPQVSVLHHGGKTLEERQRFPQDTLALRQAELAEHKSLLARWTPALGNDPNYNRNLSLSRPFDLEQDIVIDWQPARRDRPRALALPLSSGSGQYRVIEPLNALQNEGKAQSCVVFPINRDVARVPTSIELVRSGLDRLIVQNAIGDLHLARMEEYRVNLPQLGVIHMLDDLFGNLPGKHHLHNYHKREGNTRLRRSLELSDRLVVTTEPLKEYYQAFVPETRVIPNALDESAWFDLPITPRERQGKLRVGWAGAQQHLGDLDMIQTVVAHFGKRVDWVFMGMCPPSIQPHVKEVHPFVSIDVYPQTLANLDLDIAIAPLEDNPFNTCKSNLRLLEYGAMGWPVICSDVYPFRTDNPPVRRVSNDAEDWITALETLMSSESLRLEMGKQLNHWVKTRYALSLHTQDWLKAIFDPISR